MKKILGLLISLIFASQAYASVAVSPTKLDINANKVKGNFITTAIDIKGDAKEPMRFRLYPGYFTINEKSEMVMEDLPSNDPHDLSKKIRFVPSEFTVMQGKSQKVRINIPNINQLPDGESRTVLYLEDVNPKEYNVNTGSSGINAQLIVKSRVAIPVYVDKGKVTKHADIEYLKLVEGQDGLYTEMKILSTGNSKVRYNAQMQILNGKKLIDEYTVSGHAVGENNYYIAKDKVETKSIEGIGEYTIRAVVYYQDENGKKQVVKKETNLNIKGDL